MKKFTAICSVIIGLFACYRLYKVFFGDDFGKHISVDNNKIFYKGAATEAEARNTGAFLNRQGFYDGKNEKDIQLDKAGDTVLFKMIVDTSKVDKNTEEAFRSLNAIFSDSVFQQKPVNVLLCNTSFEPYQTYYFTAQQPAASNSATGVESAVPAKEVNEK